MFSSGIRQYLNDLTLIADAAKWKYKESTLNNYLEAAKKLKIDQFVGYEAHSIFEPIRGELGNGSAINPLYVLENSMYIPGYAYLTDRERKYVIEATNGDFSFSLDSFIRFKFRKKSPEDLYKLAIRKMVMIQLKIE